MAESAPIAVSDEYEYDHQHELALVKAITNAVTRTSRIGGVPTYRVPEITAALVGVLAHFLAATGVASGDDENFEHAVETVIAVLVAHLRTATERLEMQPEGGQA